MHGGQGPSNVGLTGKSGFCPGSDLDSSDNSCRDQSQEKSRNMNDEPIQDAIAKKSLDIAKQMQGGQGTMKLAWTGKSGFRPGSDSDHSDNSCGPRNKLRREVTTAKESFKESVTGEVLDLTSVKTPSVAGAYLKFTMSINKAIY